MSEQEKRSREVPEQTADAAAATSEDKRGLYAFALAALMLGFSFVKGILKTPAATDEIPASSQTAATAPMRAPEKTEPVAKRDRDREVVPETATRQRWGTLLVACMFILGAAAGVGFLIVYWSGGNNLLLGGTLALCFGGFGAALVFSAQLLVPHKEATEPREQLPSKPVERDAAFEAFCAGAHDVQRRSMLKWMGAAGTGLLAAMVVSLMRSLGTSPRESLFTTVWKREQRLMTFGGKPITVDSLQPGDSLTVFPEDSVGSEKTQTVLIRVHEQLLQLPNGRADWAPKGYLAYSRVCTHAGCPVGLFEAEANLLLCPCHQSTFDVLRGAVPTSGPAARPLPQLPLYVDSDGTLRAAGGFTAPPGPGFTGMPL